VHPGGIRTNIERASRRVKLADETEARVAAKGDKLLITPPERCAADILRGVERGKRRILTGNKATSLFWISRLFPNSYPRLLRLIA
jgi:short-subunit dehydrogenase